MIQQNTNVLILADHDYTRCLGAYRLASDIRSSGYTCQVIDKISKFNNEELVWLYSTAIGKDTLVLGISTTFFNMFEYDHNPNIAWGLISRLIFFARKVNPTIKIVIGGGMTFQPTPALTEKVDLTITGMGEHALLQYLSRLTGRLLPIRYASTEFDIFNSETIFHPSDNIRSDEPLPIELARGCIFKCKFCSYPLLGKKKNDYMKSKNAMKNEFIRNYNEFGVTRYSIVDSTHNDNNVKLQDLADVVQSLPFKLEYCCFIRIDLLRSKPEQYQMLIDSGMTGCFFGIETLNSRSAKCIGKGLDSEKVVEELYTFKERMPDVGTCGAFICGLPYETKETIDAWSKTIIGADFPLDEAIMQALSIDRSGAGFQSEFERNSDKYYTWENPWTWNNGDFNRDWAEEFSDEFKKRSSVRARIGGWNSVVHLKPWNTTVIKKPLISMDPWLRKHWAECEKTYKKALGLVG